MVASQRMAPGIQRIQLELLFPMALFLIFTAAGTAFADQRATVELELYNLAGRENDGSWSGMAAGMATYSLQQTGNRSVRSELELSALISPTSPELPDASFSVGKAYTRFRHSDFRGTIGKAPFSWGEGLIFNVADTMFLSGTGTDLMQSEFEDASAWLAGASWYFGPFSFVELIVTPDVIETTRDETGQVSGYSLPAAEDLRAGARFVGKPGAIKAEAGYLFDGRDGYPISVDGETAADDSGGDSGLPLSNSAALQEGGYYHRPYLSLQGNLVVDWHLSASLEFTDSGTFTGNAEKGLLISSGLYSLIPIGYDDTIGFRLESLIHPDGRWSEQSGVTEGYGAYGYGELTYDFGSGVALTLRSLVNPVDVSARISPGLTWNLFQGFTLLGYARVQTGDSDDTYPFESETDGGGTADGGTSAGTSSPLQSSPTAGAFGSTGGLAVMLGCSVVY